MSFAAFRRADVALRYRDTGAGPPVVFQHGLGGDEAQVADVFPDVPAVRRVTLECRGQGGSAFGPRDDFSIATFSGDVEALADRLRLEPFVAGGISMGAAIALRLAVGRPKDVRALVLARPAWIVDAAPPNLHPYALVGELLRTFSPAQARARFETSDVAARLAREAPDNLSSLVGFFDRPEPETFGSLLSAIASDGPGLREADLRALDMPVLVIGTDRDFAHPLATAETLSEAIPRARLVQITSKAVDPEAYRTEFRRALSDFLNGLQ